MSKRCIKCGAKLPDEASFCPNCMTSQVEREHIEPPKPRRKNGRPFSKNRKGDAGALTVPPERVEP